MNSLRTRQKSIDLDCASKNQPLDFSLAVLEPLNKISVIFMKIGETEYELHEITLMGAVDILFKCIISLGHPWPATNKHVWLYLKYHVYGIASDTTFDCISYTIRLNEQLAKVKTPQGTVKKTKKKKVSAGKAT